MSGQRGEIFLGDLVTAVHTLRADSLQIDRIIARQLGLFGMEMPRSGAVPGAYAHDNAPGQHPARTPADTRGAPSTIPPSRGSATRPAALDGAPLPMTVTVERTQGHTPGRPDWLTDSAPLPQRDSQRSFQPHQPIIPKHQNRGIISAAVSVRREEGPADIERLVDYMAHGRPLTRLPRLPIPTLRNGCQLLVDRGEAMAPFADDVSEFEAALDAIVGTERIQALDFIGSPVRGTRLSQGRIEAQWLPPLPGTPLVLLTDLGIGGPALSRERGDLDEWQTFAKQAKAAQCPIIAFVPFAPSRWPRALPNHFLRVHWDRRTTAGTLRRVIGPGHRSVR